MQDRNRAIGRARAIILKSMNACPSMTAAEWLAVFQGITSDLIDEVRRVEHQSTVVVSESMVMPSDLSVCTIRDLKRIAKEHQIAGYWNMTKEELLEAIAPPFNRFTLQVASTDLG